MSYPPESSWNDPPTAAQIASMNEALRILKRPEVTEMNRPATRWQARDAMKELWDEVNDRPRVKLALIKKELENKVNKMQCSCFEDYDKNLLISALASYKAEINTLIPKLLAIEEKEAGKRNITAIFGSRLSNIDKMIKEVENTPDCKEE